MLKIQFKDRRKAALWLVDSTLKIGSDPSCDILVDEPGVDPSHVELLISQDDVLLKNISAQRSVFVNEIPIVKEQALVAWDQIRLGNSVLEIIDPLKERPVKADVKLEQKTIVRAAISPWMLKAISAPLDGQYFSLAHGQFIGRDEACDIVVPLTFVSRKHLQIGIRQQKLFIEDLGSSNGTHVNGEKIKSCELRNGDEVKLDEFIFSVIGPASKQDQKARAVVRDKKGSKTQSKIAAKPKNKPLEKKEIADRSVFFHGLSSDVQGKVFEITKVENHISRMLGHHLSTSEQSVSARHVYLYETELGWEIKNDGASDGLMINGKMQPRAVLQEGDEILIGGTRLKFQCVGDQPLNYSQNAKSSSKGKIIVTSIILIAAIAAAGVYFGFTLPK